MHTHTETSDPRHNVKVALACARAGIRVFPAVVKPPTGGSRSWLKQPLIKGWSANASADEQQISKWWREHPSAVPGIPLEHINGIVIDQDRHGAHDGVVAFNDLVEIHGPLPKCPVTETPGDGLHLIFRQPFGKRLGNRTGDLPAGIDVRGYGGWIVAPGSKRPDGKAWEPRSGAPLLTQAFKSNTIPVLPPWVVDLIEPKARREEPLRYDRPDHDFVPYAQRALVLICGDLARTKEGQRNTALNNAAMRLGSMVARGWLDQHEAIDGLWRSSEANGYVAEHGADATQATIASGFAAGMKRPAPDPEDKPRTGAAQMNGQRPPNRGERRAVQSTVRRLVSRRLADVQMRPIEWLWFGRIAVGKHTTVAGEPGIGKSTVLYWIAAAISKGAPWPCGEGTAPKGSVIILSAEDGAEDTIKPRVLAAGGDATKVYVITATRDDEGKVSTFTLQSDLQALEAMIDDLGDVRLVIIDPISSYLGDGVDGHSNTDIRRVVEPLHEMADRKKVAVLTNTHFAKSGASNKSRAAHRVIGSTAFIALPRVALAVAVDPEDENRRLVLHLKNNIARAAPGLAFRLVQTKAGDIGQPPVELYASCVEWEAEYVDTTADQAIADHEARMRGDVSKRPSPDTDEAERFLRDYLADGPKSAKEVTKAARDACVNVGKPLRTARERLCETVQTRSDDGKVVTGWLWKLKPDATTRGGDT